MSADEELKLINFSTAWTIENFSSYLHKRDPLIEIRSPSFLVNRQDSMYMIIKIIKDPEDKFEKDRLSIFVHFSMGKPITAEIDFSLLNSENEEFKFDNQLPIFHIFDNSLGFGRKYFLKKNNLLDPKYKLLQDEKLIIICKIRFLNIKLPLYEFFKHSTEELKKLYENKEFCDLTLNVCGKDLQVHKAILAAKSSVFCAMFSNNCQESIENIVKIDDISFNVMKELVHFIYTEKVVNIEKHAKDLLVAADKYCIDDLKIFLCRYFCEKLNIENAAEMYLLSDLYNVSNFKTFVEYFMQTNLERIMDTAGFSNAKKSNPSLLLGFVCDLIKGYIKQKN